jgi:hypothetical protein
MQKALLISILFATMLIPIAAARTGSVNQAVRRTIGWMTAFCVLYWLMLLYVYPSLRPEQPHGEAVGHNVMAIARNE